MGGIRAEAFGPYMRGVTASRQQPQDPCDAHKHFNSNRNSAGGSLEWPCTNWPSSVSYRGSICSELRFLGVGIPAVRERLVGNRGDSSAPWVRNGPPLCPLPSGFAANR